MGACQKSASLISEKFTSWLSHNSIAPDLLRCVSGARKFSAAPPPPPQAEAQESYLNATSSSYVEEMFEAWSYDPKSVHASWDAYFRGGSYTSPPSLGASSRPNEVPLASLLPGLASAGSGLAVGGGQASSAVIDAHLAVQATIRSYQVRGHLAAQIDPLGLNNMDREQAKKMIIRSVTVDEKVIQLLQLSGIFQIQF